MNAIAPPLTLSDHGDAVADLQDALAFLLERRSIRVDATVAAKLRDVLKVERRESLYDDATKKLVAIFQEQQEFDATGDVDGRTADALNALLRELRAFDEQQPRDRPRWVVRGVVADAERPLNDVVVSVFDRDLFFGREGVGTGQAVGTTVTSRSLETGEEGWFEIIYTAASVAAGDIRVADVDPTPDLVFSLTRDGEPLKDIRVVRVADGADLVVSEVVSEAELILGIQARPLEEVVVFVGGTVAPSGASEYERVWRAIEPLLPARELRDAVDRQREAEVCGSAVRFDEARYRDLTFVARETHLAPELVNAFAKACQLAVRLEGVSAVVLYGLARAAGLADVRALGTATVATLDAGLRRAVDEKTIPQQDESGIALTVETIRRQAAVRALEDPVAGGASLASALGFAIEDPAQQADLLRLAADFEGTRPEFWRSLGEHEAFRGRVDEIRYSTQLASLTQANVPLMRTLKAAAPAASSLRTLALELDRDALRRAVDDPQVAIPESVPGVADEERRALYADALADLLRNAEPTAAGAHVARAVAAEPEQTQRLSPAAAEFLVKAVQEHEDFDLMSSRLTDFESLVEGPPEARKQTLAEAQRVQRLFRISTSETNLTGLLRSEFRSAYHITQAQTLKGFVGSHATALGGEAEAALAYRRATAVSAASLVLAIQAHQMAFDVTPRAVPGGPKVLPSWAQMFGSVDLCVCEQCRSWHGAAAYFVDLLLFLDRAGGAAGKTPLQVLLDRRPDLAHLMLSCENTNTTLPYVDLVNEVLESCVAGGGNADASAAHDVTSESAAELRAAPRHLQVTAYEVLAQQVHSPVLPFDRSLEIARAYLQHLGVARQDLLGAFEHSYGPAETAKHRERVAEALGLSEREHEVLVGEKFDGTPVAVGIQELSGIDLTAIERDLKKGDTGPSVYVVQAKLRGAGNGLTLSGEFDDALVAAVTAFQQGQGLPDPGAVDAATWGKLHALTPDTVAVFTSSVSELLDRTGLTLTELAQILKCRFVNPADALNDMLVEIYAAFGVTSRDLRAFMQADPQAEPDPELGAKVAKIGKTLADLRQAVDAALPAAELATLIALYSDVGADGEPAKLLIQRADGTPLPADDLRRLHVFVRLWRKLGWDLADLDHNLLVLAPDRKLTPATLESLARMQELRRRTVSGDVMAGELEVLTALTGIDPGAGAQSALELAEVVEFVRGSDFAVADLDYLYGEEPAGPSALAPSADDLEGLRKRLDEGRAQIATEQAQPEDADSEFLQQKLALVLEPEPAALALALIEGRAPMLTPAQIGEQRDQFAAAQLASGDLAKDAAPFVFPNWVELGEGDADEATRRARVRTAAEHLRDLVADVHGRSLVKQTLSEILELDPKTVQTLIEDHADDNNRLGALLRSIASPTEPAVTTFLSSGAPNFEQEFGRLHRIALLVRALRLTVPELRYLAAHGADFGGFDLARYGETPNGTGFGAWQRLAAYAALRNRLTRGPVRLVDVFAATDRATQLAAATGWDKALIDGGLLACGKSGVDLTDERVVAVLERIIGLARRIGAPPSTLKAWALEPPSAAQADAIAAVVRGKHSLPEWLDVAAQVNDPLRERAREALVAHVLTLVALRASGVRTAADLFGRLLIDVEMSACMLTSRIKQAISSTQLFVQRCLLNLERDAPPATIDVEQWEWRKNYRVWEANRKIFLFPENWLEPELRDDKTPFFRELESKLLEADVTNETAEQAFAGYLENLRTVARLEVCGFYWESDPDVLHVFGRTSAGVPRTYYYRRLVAGKEWTPWEPVGVDIQGVEKDDDNHESGVHLLPIVWGGKLYLFWPQFVKKADKKTGVNVKAGEAHDQAPAEYWEVKLAWSRYERARWTPKKVSGDFLTLRRVARAKDAFEKKKRVDAESAVERAREGGTLFDRLAGGYALGRGERGMRAASTDDAGGTVPDVFDGDPVHLRMEARNEGVGLRILMAMETTNSSSTVSDTVALNAVFADSYADPVVGSGGGLVQRPLLAGLPEFQRQTTSGALTVGAPPAGISERTTILAAGQATPYFLTMPGQGGLPPLRPLTFYQDDLHCYLAYLFEGSETVWPRVEEKIEPAERSARLGRVVAGPPELARIIELAAPPGPRATVYERSPWQGATETLLPAKLEAGMRRAGIGLTPQPAESQRQVWGRVVGMLDDSARGALIGGALPAATTRRTVDARFVRFFHPHAAEFERRFRHKGIDGLLALDTQQLGDSDGSLFRTAYNPVDGRVRGPLPNHDVDFSHGGAYSAYNWELFFHVPVLFATRLSLNHRFVDAQKWFHRVFSPLDASATDDPRTFWQLRPFRDANPERLVDLFSKLKPGDTNSPDEQQVVDQLEALTEHPFQPHRIARLRQVAYQKYVFMGYVENLIAWGDKLFARDTIEAINEATQLYVLAAQLLGERPQKTSTGRRAAAKSFAELRPLLDKAGNALDQVETDVPLAAFVAPINGSGGVSALLQMGAGLYFCIPQNEKLLGYWDTVEDRLFKIRNCMNLEGTVRQLALFEPPIDPALLVRAAAAGLDIGSVLSDLAAPLPRYRFPFMFEKAMELCNEVRALGAAMLSALEKKEGEALALMRAEHELAAISAVTKVREWQVAEAEASIAALEASRELTVFRLLHYSGLLGETAPTVTTAPPEPLKPDAQQQVGTIPPYATTGRFELTDGGKITLSGAAVGAAAGEMLAGPAGSAVGGAVGAAIGDIDLADLDSGAKILKYEQDELYQSALGTGFSLASAATEGLAAVLALIPQAEIALKPLGLGGSVSFGGHQLAAPPTIAGRVLSALSTWHHFQSSLAARLATFVWREQDHALQRNLAAREIEQIDRQIIAAQIRRQVARAELKNQAELIEHAADVDTFMKEKYTATELYGWMERRVGEIFFRAYQLAYTLAKQAERCYAFELGVEQPTFIQFGYWDSFRKGLLAGEQLNLALRQMERAHLEQNRREYELTRHISLLQLKPEALLALRQSGTCEFELPESLFDTDFAGHYYRRIKSVSVSVPSVVGPYTTISGTLTLLSNRIRTKTSGDYSEKQDDPRFMRDHVPLQAIATSNAQNDPGMFELNFRDERYLPFEGAGALSKWRFELPPELRQFDYDTISDVVLHVRYTARDGGQPLRDAANKTTSDKFASDASGLTRMFSVRHEFPSEWHRFIHPPTEAPPTLTLAIDRDRFPYLGKQKKQLETLRVRLVPLGQAPDLQEFELEVVAPPAALGIRVTLPKSGTNDAPVYLGDLRTTVGETAEWTLTPSLAAPDLGNLQDLVILCDYRLKPA